MLHVSTNTKKKVFSFKKSLITTKCKKKKITRLFVLTTLYELVFRKFEDFIAENFEEDTSLIAMVSCMRKVGYI